MSYIALYRKYRPQTFDSIIGQESVTKILKNQIINGKISHAYIFSGTRGTGKTSAAKVFARAINCLNPQNGEPCNECEVCKNILESNTTDVIEMDAASNNSVENIRQIRQEVVYATVDVKYRVYIIDEAHMLTTSAFNALLKTLEEPPSNVVFILATTEQHKIPVTILSRCLRFDFNRISEEDIIKRLHVVLEKESIKYEEEAIEYIAKLAEGGMRDSLSILERCISEAQDVLKYDDVVKIVGSIDKKTVSDIIESIDDLDSVTAINKIDEIVKTGKDLRQVNYALTEEFLNKLINEKDNKVRYTKIIDRLSKLDNDLRLTSKPAIVFKACIVELCNYTNETSSNGNTNSVNNVDNNMSKKIANLENEIIKLNTKISQLQTMPVKMDSKTSTNEKIVSNTVSNITQTNNNSNGDGVINREKVKLFQDSENLKKKVIELGHIKLYSSLASAKIYTDEASIIVVTNNSFAYSILILDENITILKEVYNVLYGSSINVYIRLKESTGDSDNNTTSKMEDLLQKNNVNYTNLD